jgi:hypothetical protein
MVVAHAVRMPSQVRRGWDADDLRLYQATHLGEFGADGALLGDVRQAGHVKPPILALAERMFRDATGPHADVAGPDLPGPLRTLLTKFPELRDTSDPRPLQMRIGIALTSQDVPVSDAGEEAPP